MRNLHKEAWNQISQKERDQSWEKFYEKEKKETEGERDGKDKKIERENYWTLEFFMHTILIRIIIRPVYFLTLAVTGDLPKFDINFTNRSYYFRVGSAFPWNLIIQKKNLPKIKLMTSTNFVNEPLGNTEFKFIRMNDINKYVRTT